MELKTVAGRVHLQIEHAGLYRLLILTAEAIEGRGEGIGDKEVHQKGVSIMSGPSGI